jgi:hypothetical protein
VGLLGGLPLIVKALAAAQRSRLCPWYGHCAVALPHPTCHVSFTPVDARSEIYCADMNAVYVCPQCHVLRNSRSQSAPGALRLRADMSKVSSRNQSYDARGQRASPMLCMCNWHCSNLDTAFATAWALEITHTPQLVQPTALHAKN